MLSSLGSLTISRKAEIPIWPFPMSSWRSSLQPRCPGEEEKEEEKKDRTVWHINLKFVKLNKDIVLVHICILCICVCVCVSPACTFGVIKMDGFKVVEPYFPIKLIQHGLHSSLGSQVVALNNKETTGAALIVVLIFHGFISHSFASTSTAWYGQNCLSQKSERHILSLTFVLLIHLRLVW